MADNESGDNVVRFTLHQAAEIEATAHAGDDNDQGGGGGQPPHRAKFDDQAPVKPLGLQGGNFYYIDANGQLRILSEQKHSRPGIASLFGKKNHLLRDYWPRWRWNKTEKDWELVGWDLDKAMLALMAACSHRGVFTPDGRVRERGAWRADDGGLVLHCGDQLLGTGPARDPGEVERYVYPAAPATPHPHLDRVPSGKGNPTEELYGQLKTWGWKRSIDPVLLLGWIGAAMIGGALKWRPIVWIAGETASGKTTLFDLVGGLFDNALLSVSDASAAAIWQRLGHSTLPVQFDEAEPTDRPEDNQKMDAIIKVARIAAAGGRLIRGGADHKAEEFVIQSCVMFSSVYARSLLPQDRNRIALLELDKPPSSGKAPVVIPAVAREIGQKLMRRMIDAWPRWNEVLELYRAALREQGHTARGADLFGTLLAAHDVLLYDELPHPDSVEQLAQSLAPAMYGEADDDTPDQIKCLHHLLGSAIPIGAPNRRAVADLATAVVYDTGIDPVEAVRLLATHGIRVDKERDPQSGKQRWVFMVMNSHPELARLFFNTYWAGRAGASGGWVQALRRIPHAEASKRTYRFGALSGRCTILPLDGVIDAPERAEPRDPLFTNQKL